MMIQAAPVGSHFASSSSSSSAAATFHPDTENPMSFPALEEVGDDPLLGGGGGGGDVKNSLSNLDELNLDFDNADNQDVFDTLLSEEAKAQFTLDDADFDTLLNGSIGLGEEGGIDLGEEGGGPGIDGSGLRNVFDVSEPLAQDYDQQQMPILDDLHQMPIVEVQYDDTERYPKEQLQYNDNQGYHDPLLGISSRLENTSLQGYNQNPSQNQQYDNNEFNYNMEEVGSDYTVPLAGESGGGRSQPHFQQQQQLPLQPPPPQQQLPFNADLEAQKMYLLNKLKAVELQKLNLAQANMLQTAQNNMRQAGFAVPTTTADLQQTTPFPTPQQRVQNRKAPMVVASAMGGGGCGESALSSFLRGSRKSMDQGSLTPPQQQQPQQRQQSGSILASHVRGAPRAASIFNHSPMDLETIHSNRNSFANDNAATLMNQGLFSSMDRSDLTQNLVQALAGGSMSRQGSGSTLGSMGGHNQLQHFSNNNGGNAGWGAVDAPTGMLTRGGGGSNSNFYMSGILRKNASESALNKSLLHNGKLMRKTSGASRENLLLKRQGSNTKLMGSQENLHGMLPVRRHNPGLKHSLSKSSRSQPHMAGLSGSSSALGGSRSNLLRIVGNSSPKYSQNAQW
jgi:hypothetical protein